MRYKKSIFYHVKRFFVILLCSIVTFSSVSPKLVHAENNYGNNVVRDLVRSGAYYAGNLVGSASGIPGAGIVVGTLFGQGADYFMNPSSSGSDGNKYNYYINNGTTINNNQTYNYKVYNDYSSNPIINNNNSYNYSFYNPINNNFNYTNDFYYNSYYNTCYYNTTNNVDNSIDYYVTDNTTNVSYYIVNNDTGEEWYCERK